MSDPTVVFVSADWKLEETGGRVYGMCNVDFGAPHEECSFSRGFTLPDPTSARVAAQSLLHAIDALANSTFAPLLDVEFVVATKCKWLSQVYNSADEYEKRGEWPAGARRIKALVQSAKKIAWVLGKRLEVVHIEREAGDDVRVDLDDIDMDSVAEKNMGNKEKLEREMLAARMRGVMGRKLAGSGARCYRVQRKTTKKKETTP